MKLRMISMAMVALAIGLLHGNSQVGKVHAGDRRDRVCSEKSLRGSYGFYRTGTTSTGQLAAVGIIVFDGNGNFMATQTTSRNGVFNFDSSFSGTYEVAEDCTGTPLPMVLNLSGW